MKPSQPKLTSREKRDAVEKIVNDCKTMAQQIVRAWKTNPEWKTVNGCAYLRLSTDEQVAVERGSLEQQIHIAVSEAEIRSQTERINYRITKFFIEPGITGTTDRRPEFRSMLAEIQQKKHAFVIMKELARITRETDVWKSFFKLCNESDCQIFIRGFPFNPNDPAQIFQLDILAAFAEYESKQTSRRVRESVFSAMITSGKFNSTHRVLGLKQREVDGLPQVGFYVPVPDELKTVRWIMETFIKYESYAATLEECKKIGVKNWNGGTFKTHSLVNLLTNSRYVGRWTMNCENKDKNQSKLMPYDRYADIELPHGCLIEIELWNRVQATIERIKGRKDKNLNINRVYPLSSMLVYQDGTLFSGGSAWKESRRHNYYYNKAKKIRLVAESIEEEARRITGEIVRGNKPLQDAIAKYCKDRTTTSDLYYVQVDKMRTDLRGLEDEKKKLNRRIDYLLDGASDAEARGFKREYRQELERLNAAIKDKHRQIDVTAGKAEALKNDEFNWREVGAKCETVLKAIQDNDPIALKTAYRHLFEAIVVGDVGADGRTELKFVLKGQNVGDFLDGVNGWKKSRVESKLARWEGLEPPTKRLTAACSTD